jgi:hypothetical protein
MDASQCCHQVNYQTRFVWCRFAEQAQFGLHAEGRCTPEGENRLSELEKMVCLRPWRQTARKPAHVAPQKVARLGCDAAKAHANTTESGRSKGFSRLGS